MESAAYFRKKAAQCRRLAASIVGDPACDALTKLAEEFDTKTAEYMAREKAARAARVGNDPAKKPYRVCFRNQRSSIIGCDNFFASDDAHAIVIARTLSDACSDLCTGFELWQSGREVDLSCGWTIPNAEEIVAKVQDIVLDCELMLQASASAIASSARLLKETDRLVLRLRG